MRDLWDEWFLGDFWDEKSLGYEIFGVRDLCDERFWG